MRMGLAARCRIMGRTISGLMSMKKHFLMLVMYLFAVTALAFAQQASSQQSLGDVARSNRAKKHPSSSSVKLDDDTVTRTATPSTSSEPDTAKKADEKAPEAKEADAKAAPKDTADAQKQKNEELKKQIEAQ